jgi:hypothetical protein
VLWESEKTFSSSHFLRTGAISGMSRRPQIANRSFLGNPDIKLYCSIH